MKRHNRKRGFTMAEMLIVVAIIGVLSAVAFIAVYQHQRSLERLERDSVAREIFIAAQNHLTTAQGMGYLGMAGSEAFGAADSSEAGVYYFAVYRGDKFATPSLLDLMLPFGAVDETVRAGGSYIIRYHPAAAMVLDVFYCSTDDRYGYNLEGAKLDELLSNYREGKEGSRRNYTDGSVLGWYGGEDAQTLPVSETPLQDPEILVENADRLLVHVKNNNGTTGELQLIVKGLSSGAQKAFKLMPAESTPDDRITAGVTINDVAYTHTVVLDDITTEGMHFADMARVNGFIPGEDIVVQAVAFDNTQITNIAYSAEVTANSLYEKLELDAEKATMTASVNSIRHLENLDKRVSNVTDPRTVGQGTAAVTYTLKKAVQTSDLDWNGFKTNTGKDAVVLYGEEAGATEAGCYLPVKPIHPLSYDGGGHSVSNVKVSYAGDAGLFGAITGSNDATDPTTLENLALVDFDIARAEGEAGNAGALAGTLTNVTVVNVVARNESRTVGVYAKAGNAGGLVGQTTGCSVTRSAAAVAVHTEAGNAGGLIGETSGGTVSACYAAGHTENAEYYETDAETGARTPIYNVVADTPSDDKIGKAGGLIGFAVDTPIEYSYATCSVKGKTSAGGFVASASAAISHCYATGLVQAVDTETVGGKALPKDGAFAYSITATAVVDCHYFEIINERPDPEAGYVCLAPLGKNAANPAILPLDADLVDDDDLSAYEDFASYGGWTNAAAYDPRLIEYYGGHYNLKTVEGLGATLKADGSDTREYFVATHTGDWPAPEIFILNTPSAG